MKVNAYPLAHSLKVGLPLLEHALEPKNGVNSHPTLVVYKSYDFF
jgi:hypothetical protein